MVIWQGIDAHIWEEEFDLLYCSLLYRAQWTVQGYLRAMSEMDSVW